MINSKKGGVSKVACTWLPFSIFPARASQRYIDINTWIGT